MNSILFQKSFPHYTNPSVFNQYDGLGSTRSGSKLESFLGGDYVTEDCQTNLSQIPKKLVNIRDKERVGRNGPLILFCIVIFKLIKNKLEDICFQALPSSLNSQSIRTDIFVKE